MYVQQTSTNIDSLYFCTFNCITFTFTFTVLFDFVRHLEAPWLASTNCTARIHDRAHSVNHQYNPLQTCDLLHDVNKNFANHFYAILWMFSFKLTHIAPLPLRLWTWFASVIISGRSDNFKKSLLSSLKTASALKKNKSIHQGSHSTWELRETWKPHICVKAEKLGPAEMMMHFEDGFRVLDGWYRKHQLRAIIQFSTRALTLRSLYGLQYNPETLR